MAEQGIGSPVGEWLVVPDGGREPGGAQARFVWGTEGWQVDCWARQQRHVRNKLGRSRKYKLVENPGAAYVPQRTIWQ